MKNKANNPTSEKALPCFECDEGELHSIRADYTAQIPESGELLVTEVPMLECNCCSDRVIGAEGSRKIEQAIKKATGAISPAEIALFLKKYDLTQRTASEITGYGEKNFSNWLNGKRRPSASVSNFLRLLLADDDAFERLKSKNWTQEQRGTCPEEERQPDKAESAVLKLIDYKKLVDLGVVPETRSPKERRTHVCEQFHCADLNVFGARATDECDLLAAFRDTNQRSNKVSGGVWAILGERAANQIDVAPYDREKLIMAVRKIREYTRLSLGDAIPEVQKALARAGVALVFVPAMKESAVRGCTRMLSPVKAMIVHSLKYRTLSQFWIILFHEIAHLLLHVETPADVFAEYENQSDDPREKEADEWAWDALFFSDHFRAFSKRYPKPTIWEIQSCAKRMKIDTAIAAEIFNKRMGQEVISYAHLNKEGMSQLLSEDQLQKVWASDFG